MYNHVALSGLPAVFLMLRISVDECLLHCFYSFRAAGASVNAAASSIALRVFLRSSPLHPVGYFCRSGLFLLHALETACILSMLPARCVPSLMGI